MKNIRETRSIPFFSLLTPEDREKIKDPEEMPDEVKPIAEALGISKPNEAIPFEVTLGSLIFDIYDALAPERPKAPLAQERENQKRQKLAKSLLQDEFELPDDVKTLLSNAMENDEAWQKVKVSVAFKVGEDTRYNQLTSEALGIFPDCRQALISIFS